MTARSTVPAKGSWAFLDRIVVDCPACGGMAVIEPTEPPQNPDNPDRDIDYRARRMTCRRCGKTIDQARTPQGQFARPHMGLNLRLRAETRQGDLIAYNEAHLDYLETYLAGELRVETPGPRGGVRNRSVISRLPTWAKAAKNRGEVLKAIAKVRLKARPDG